MGWAVSQWLKCLYSTVLYHSAFSPTKKKKKTVKLLRKGLTYHMFVSICSLLGVKGVFRKLAFGLAQLGCPHPIGEYPCSGPSFLLTYTLRGSSDGISGQVLPPTEETGSHVWLLALDPGQPPPLEDSGEGSELAVDVLLSLSLCFQIKACGKWEKKKLNFRMLLHQITLFSIFT